MFIKSESISEERSSHMIVEDVKTNYYKSLDFVMQLNQGDENV